MIVSAPIQWPVLVINMDRSPERMASMEARFHNENLIRVQGVDGMEWQGEDTDRVGRPLWKDGVKRSLIERGILGDREIYPLIPTEVGCALSHVRAWEYIVKNELKFAFVLEDDVQPAEAYCGSLQESVVRQGGIPSDADVLFLTGEDSNWCRIRRDADGRLLYGQCNFGYLITLDGARKAIMAQLPMFLPCDVQWWALAFKNYEVWVNVQRDGIVKGYAYAMNESIIKIAADGYRSTMTVSGEKPWRQTHYEV